MSLARGVPPAAADGSTPMRPAKPIPKAKAKMPAYAFTNAITAPPKSEKASSMPAALHQQPSGGEDPTGMDVDGENDQSKVSTSFVVCLTIPSDIRQRKRRATSLEDDAPEKDKAGHKSKALEKSNKKANASPAPPIVSPSVEDGPQSTWHHCTSRSILSVGQPLSTPTSTSRRIC